MIISILFEFELHNKHDWLFPCYYGWTDWQTNNYFSIMLSFELIQSFINLPFICLLHSKWRIDATPSFSFANNISDYEF